MASSSSPASTGLSELAPASPCHAPSLPLIPTKLGVLTRKNVNSPEVLHVFPLRIRDWDKQDVALIGATFVHIKQVNNDGSFVEVASKSDFPSRIRAAQVIGSTNGNLPLSQSPGPHDQQHAHILLLTLDTPELVLVTMSLSPTLTNRYIFETQSVQLPASEKPFMNPGRFIATDPYSRAVAVGAPGGFISIFELNHRSQWGNGTRDVIKSHTALEIGHRIVQMEFLYNPGSSPELIGLLVLGYDPERRRGRLLVQLYQWESGHLTQENPPQQIIHAPPHKIHDHSIPLMLIPLRKNPGGFIIACEYKFGLYTEAFSGTLVPAACLSTTEILPHVFTTGQDVDQAASPHKPLWKTWARPPRNDPHIPRNSSEEPQSSDYIYIAREDGVVALMEVSTTEFCLFSFAGKMNGRVERAFNHDGRSLSAPDSLVFGGSLSDGGVFTAGLGLAYTDSDHRERPEAMSFIQTDTVYNWAPLLDIASNVTRSSPRPATKLMSTSGKSPYGAISELRYGCEAVVKRFVDLHESDVLTRVWPFETSNGRVAAFTSSPAASTFYSDLSGQSEPSITALATGAILAATRVTSAVPHHSSSQDVAICITRLLHDSAAKSAVVVYRLVIDALDEDSLQILHEEPLETQVSIASVEHHVQYNRTQIVTGSGNAIQLRELRITDSKVSVTLTHQHTLSHAVTAISLFHLGPHPSFTAIGVADGHLYILCPNNDTFDTICHSQRGNIIDSIAVIVSGSSARIICGGRDGSLTTYVMEMVQQGCQLRLLHQATLDPDKPIEVTTSSQNSQSIVIRSESQALLASFTPRIDHPPRIHRIHFMDIANPSFSPGTISALALLSDPIAGNGIVLNASSKSLYVSSLSSYPQALPRRLPVPGEPNRVIWSESWKCFFAATLTPYTVNGSRFLCPEIIAVDPTVPAERATQRIWSGTSSHYKFTSLMEWKVDRSQDGKNKRRVFLVASVVDLNDNHNAVASSLRFLRVAKTRDDRWHAIEKAVYDEPSIQINSICQYDADTIIYCGWDNHTKIAFVKQRRFYSGQNSASGQLNCQARILHRDASQDATGQLMTVHGPFVAMSTKSASFRMYRMSMTPQGQRELVPHFNDNGSRQGLGHLVLDMPSHAPYHPYALWTDKAGHLLGQAITNDTNTSMYPAFEVRLPVSLSRLIQSNVRPSWKQRNPKEPTEKTIASQQVVGDVLGTATDGSVWSITVFLPGMSRLLGFVQNLCLKNSTLCPGLNRGARNIRGHVMPPENAPADGFHIDGNTLAILAESPDACQLLLAMISEPVHVDVATSPALSQDFTDAARRIEAFNNLVETVKSDNHHHIVNRSPPAVHGLSLRGSRQSVGEEVDDHQEYFWRNVCTTIAIIRRVTDVPF